MKTPKRHIELTTMTHDGLEMVWDNSQWNVSTQRWKRKNREAQYKRTIKRLKEKYIDLLRGTEMTALQGSLRETKEEKDEFFKRLIDGARAKIQEYNESCKQRKS